MSDCKNCKHLVMYDYKNKSYSCELRECEFDPVEQEPTTKNDLGVDWERYKDADGNCLDDLILEVLQNNFDCGNTYGYKVADEIVGLLPSITPQEPIMDKITEIIEPLRHLSIDEMSDIEWQILRVIDKYNAETEAGNGNNNH